MRPLIVLGLGMLLAFSACDTSHEDPLQPLVPQIQEGDMWIMTKEMRLGTNFPDPPLSESTVQDTFRVQGTKIVNEEIWFNIENREGYGLFTLFRGLESYYSLRENGIWQLGPDDSEIHIIRYPIEENVEVEITEGMFSSVTSLDTLFTVPDLGTVPAISFSNRYSTAFKPFTGQNDRDEFRPLTLERELVKKTYFSSELGVLKREMFFVTIGGPSGTAKIAGSVTWDLVSYLPAGAQ